MSLDEQYYLALNAMTASGGVSNDKIKATELELGVSFPASYREFLAKYGAARGVGFELAGIFESSKDGGPPMWMSVMVITKQLRRVFRGALPNHLIPISDDGQDTKYYMDAESEAGRILAYGPGVDGQIVAASFKEFVVKASDGEL